MRKDERVKHKIGDSVKEAIYQLGGVRAVPPGGVPVSSLYKYLNGQAQHILTRNAHKIANALKLKPVFNNGVFDVEINNNAKSPQLISPRYCFNCGNKLTDKGE